MTKTVTIANIAAGHNSRAGTYSQGEALQVRIVESEETTGRFYVRAFNDAGERVSAIPLRTFAYADAKEQAQRLASVLADSQI